MTAREGFGALGASVVVLAGCACGGARPEVPREPALAGMVWIPAGEFIFGCGVGEAACPEHEQPRRSLRLPAFQIGVYEVTDREYAACVAAGGCVESRLHYDGAPLLPSNANEEVDGGVSADPGPDDGSRSPIQVYAIEEARAYCTWRGLRLPTSIEWEKAARGVDGRPFPWGSEAPDCDRAAFCMRQVYDEIFRAVGDVGIHPRSRSPYGLEDMAGNAPEWTECPPGIPKCGGIVRSPDHMGEDGLRTYAGYVTEGAFLFFHAGFRCAK